jgi:hypothetical protein
MEKLRKGVKKILVLSASFVRKAWVTIVLFLLAVVMIASGVYFSSQPEWTIRADVRVYNEGVAAYHAPPGILPASEWRPPEGPIERTAACFEKAASESKDKKFKSIAFYNLGTIAGREAYAFGQTGTPRVGTAAAVSKLAEAVRNDPNNEDAKYNLEIIEKLQVAVEEEGAGPGPGYAPGHVDKGY